MYMLLELKGMWTHCYTFSLALSSPPSLPVLVCKGLDSVSLGQICAYAAHNLRVLLLSHTQASLEHGRQTLLQDRQTQLEDVEKGECRELG